MVQELIVYNDSKFKKNIGISLPHEKEVWKCLFIKNLASAEIAGDKKNCLIITVYLKKIYFTDHLLGWVMLWVLKQSDSVSNILLLTLLLGI